MTKAVRILVSLGEKCVFMSSGDEVSQTPGTCVLSAALLELCLPLQILSLSNRVR